MPNPARKNYGKDTLKKGDIVYIYGESTTPFRVKKIENYEDAGGRVVTRVTLLTTWGRTTFQHPEDLRLAPSGEDARFNLILKDRQSRAKADREEARARKTRIQAELQEFEDFCEQDPATQPSGELWERLRGMSDEASSQFVNAGFKFTGKSR